MNNLAGTTRTPLNLKTAGTQNLASLCTTQSRQDKAACYSKNDITDTHAISTKGAVVATRSRRDFIDLTSSVTMKLLSTAALAILAQTISSAPTNAIKDVTDYTFQLVHPVEGFSIKVPNELYIVMCKDIEFGSPCYGGYVAPGLCCKLHSTQMSNVHRC